MLTRIRLRGYKSLVDVDVRLQPLTVLLGPNGAGKSNFLDALQLLSRLATRATVREAFEPPYRGAPLESFTLGSQGIQSLLEQESVSLHLSVDVELSSSTTQEMNRSQEAFVSRILKRRRSSRDVRDLKAYQAEFAYRPGDTVHYEATLEAVPTHGIVRLVRESISRSGLGLEIEPSIDTPSGLDSDPGSGPDGRDYWVYHDDFQALRRELTRWSFFYFEPRERMREPNVVREIRHIGMMGENLASFLNTLKLLDPAEFKALELSLQTLVPTLSGIDVGVSARGEVELRLLEGNTPIPASVVSEGTLRLLGLLALVGAKERPTLIGFEEPENGVHPRRIRLIAELLKSYADAGETQVIVTTHSPILLDALPRESLYVCRKVGGQTTITQLTQLDPLGRDNGIAAALNGAEDELAISERVLRGDFDA